MQYQNFSLCTDLAIVLSWKSILIVLKLLEQCCTLAKYKSNVLITASFRSFKLNLDFTCLTTSQAAIRPTKCRATDFTHNICDWI